MTYILIEVIKFNNFLGNVYFEAKQYDIAL